jgi:hypothetical protein
MNTGDRQIGNLALQAPTVIEIDAGRGGLESVFQSYSRHLGPRYHPDQDKDMPTLFRLLFVAGTLTAIVFTGLYVLATKFEPEQQTISKPVTGVKIRR